MEKYIVEKREATPEEKSCRNMYDIERKGIIRPQFMGAEEAEKRLAGRTLYPVVFVTRKSGYVPVRFRNDSYIIIK